MAQGGTFRGSHAMVLLALSCLAMTPGHAQSQEAQDATAQVGQTATVGAGEVGQRQTREDATSIKPIGRIGTRIQNRIESRTRSRLDRDYRQPTESAAAVAAADERTRQTGRSSRR